MPMNIDMTMIKEAIKNLSDSDFADLLTWLADQDYQRWDEQLRKDINSGKLDFLISESRAEMAHRLTTISKILDENGN